MSFLQDRVRGQYAIPRLAVIIRQRALVAGLGHAFTHIFIENIT